MGYFVKRVEGMTSWPDIMIVKNGRTTFLELKTIDYYPVREGTTINPEWRLGQLSWMERFRAKGGYAYLALWIDEDVWFLIPQDHYTRKDITRLSRGLSGGVYDKGSNT